MVDFPPGTDRTLTRALLVPGWTEVSVAAPPAGLPTTLTVAGSDLASGPSTTVVAIKGPDGLFYPTTPSPPSPFFQITGQMSVQDFITKHLLPGLGLPFFADPDIVIEFDDPDDDEPE